MQFSRFISSAARGKYLPRAASTCSALLLVSLAPAHCAPQVLAPVFDAVRAQATDYRLGPADVLDVRLSNHPNLNRTDLTVRPDGKITFPRVGDVTVTGLTTLQLAAKLKTELQRTLNNVRIEVEVKTARPRLARVIGAVKLPSAYDIKTDWRVVDLIAAAGGLSAPAERVSGRIIRGNQILPLDVPSAMNRPNSAANFDLQPDDLLDLQASTVPYQVTVAGNVKLPGPYDLEDGLTLPKLLARAGGTIEGAILKEAQITRKGEAIAVDISPDQLQDPTSPAARFVLQQGDVLSVPQNDRLYLLQGQVAKPSLYLLPEEASDATPLRLLTEAGGALPDADLKNAVLTRTVDGVQQRTIVDLEAIQQGLAPDTLQLQSGDILLIPVKDKNLVYVSGQVAKTGPYELTDKMSLLSLIATAGGSTSTTGLAKAYVLRDGKQIPLNLESAFGKGGAIDPAVASFQLQTGDNLIIPNVTTPQITIAGEVGRPGLFNLDNNSSVSALLAQAGSGTAEASYAKAYVERKGQRIPLNLNPVLRDGTPNTALSSFQFQEGDVLTVPKNEVKYAVVGQVLKPGNFAYPDDPKDATVLKAVTAAGGPLAAGADGGANLKGATIVRIVNDQTTTIPVNLDALFRNTKQAGDNIVMKPGDVLFIPPKKPGFSIASALGPLSALSLLLR